MIDWDRPVRTVRSQRRLFVTGWQDNRWRVLDTIATSALSGFSYDNRGVPVLEGCPWGPIENTPEDDVFLPLEHVEKKDAINREAKELRDAAQAAQVERENAHNPLWGMF